MSFAKTRARRQRHLCPELDSNAFEIGQNIRLLSSSSLRSYLGPSTRQEKKGIVKHESETRASYANLQVSCGKKKEKKNRSFKLFSIPPDDET